MRIKALGLVALASLGVPALSHAQGTTSTICDALKLLKDYNMADGALGVFFANLPSCSTTSPSGLYYHGSAPMDGTLTDLALLPVVTSGAYFCGIADAHGASASSTFSTLGKFGVESTFKVTQRDSKTASLRAERVGKLFLFGAGATLEKQELILSTPGEKASAQFGGYLRVQSKGVTWDWDPDRLRFPIATVGAGTIMIGVDLELHGRTPFVTMGNNLLVDQPGAPYRYDGWQSCLSANTGCGPQFCAPSCGPSRPVPYEKYKKDHSGTCTGACSSLSDSMLPYHGAFGGASGGNANYIYMTPFRNWFHLGHTGPSGALPAFSDGFVPIAAEPVARLNTDDFASLARNATTWGKLKVDASWDAALAKITLGTTTTLAVRDGFAVRQLNHPQLFDLGTQSRDDITFQTAIDAEAAFDVDAKVIVDISLPAPFDPPPIEVPIDNIVHENPPPRGRVATEIVYGAETESQNPHSKFESYSVLGQPKADPDAARIQCQFDPAAPISRPPTPLSNPGAFLKEVAKNSIDALHPCNVSYCAMGNQYQCAWNSSTKQLACTATPGCTNCSHELDICDATGKVIRSKVRWDHNVEEPRCRPR